MATIPGSDPSPRYSGRAWELLYLIFALKQQYKNSRLLAGGALIFTTCGLVLRRYTSAAAAHVVLPSSRAAPHCWCKHRIHGRKQRGGGRRRPRGHPLMSPPPQKKNLPRCRGPTVAPNNQSPLGSSGKGNLGHFYNPSSTIMSMRLLPRACNTFMVKIQSRRNQFRVPHKYNLE